MQRTRSLFAPFRAQGLRIVAGLLLAAIGCTWIARNEIAQQREAFETDARIVHRLLSQQVVQHDAILSTLALLQPDAAAAPERLASLYPQIIGVVRRDADGTWPDEALARAEAESHKLRRPALADLDFAAERYRIVLASSPASYALLLQARNMVPWQEWPMQREASPVCVRLEHAGQRLTLQPGDTRDDCTAGWHFEFHKHLASESQAFDVVLARRLGPGALPWAWMGLWVAAVALAMTAQGFVQRQREARRRAEELLRLGHVARLNTMGEMAAGMAHELNQPLTAVLANTQAARRLLQEDPPELDVARDAMNQAAEQARRASDVVSRLRRSIERPELASQPSAQDLPSIARKSLDLLAPEFARRQVRVQVQAPAQLSVVADGIALEQIVHNLLMNALQALDSATAVERRVDIDVRAEGDRGVLHITDSGPGIPADVLPRIFEPFFTTREGGLGLGLSLCESLATGMGGTLTAQSGGARPGGPGGARFTLTLPLYSGEQVSA